MNHGVWCKNKKYARRSIDGSFYLMKYGGFFTKKKKKKLHAVNQWVWWCHRGSDHIQVIFNSETVNCRKYRIPSLTSNVQNLTNRFLFLFVWGLFKVSHHGWANLNSWNNSASKQHRHTLQLMKYTVRLFCLVILSSLNHLFS